jgi:hypothetical protein
LKLVKKDSLMLDEVDESYAIRKTMDMKANNKNKATKSKK